MAPAKGAIQCTKIALRVIPEPHDSIKTLFANEGVLTVVVYGPTRNHDYVCGGCGPTLIVGMRPEQIGNLAVKCAACGAFNEYPAPPP